MLASNCQDCLIKKEYKKSYGNVVPSALGQVTNIKKWVFKNYGE